ncbi:MAG: ATP-binding protein [Sterolibacterium sp.]
MVKPQTFLIATALTGRNHLLRLIWLRGLAIVSFTIMLASAGQVFHIVVPLTVPLILLTLWAALSLLTWLRLKRETPVGSGELLAQLGADLVMLTALLAFSGGPANPLTTFYLPPVAVAAAILPARHAWIVAGLSVIAYSLLWLVSIPLTVEDVDRAMQMHLTGMWLTFAASALLIAGFVTRMTASLRKQEQQLASAREQALRDERIVALGNLAAGAAHQLGTPLATMAILAGELAEDPATPTSQREDLILLREQIAACKNIISGLTANAGVQRADDGATDGGSITIDRWIERLVAYWRTLRPQVAPRLSVTGNTDTAPPPLIFGDATLEHALLSLLNNAADASPADIDIVLHWMSERLQLEILDRGPGFEAALLQHAGQEFFSTRPEGVGIGLFLAHATIIRHGGNISIEARTGGGTLVRVDLPLRALLANPS